MPDQELQVLMIDPDEPLYSVDGDPTIKDPRLELQPAIEDLCKMMSDETTCKGQLQILQDNTLGKWLSTLIQECDASLHHIPVRSKLLKKKKMSIDHLQSLQTLLNGLERTETY